MYLKSLLDRYNGDLKKSLAAYNAGERAVDQSGGVPAIPETQQYVQKVTDAYFRPGSGHNSSLGEFVQIPRAPGSGLEWPGGVYERMKRIFSVRFQSAIRPALFAVGLAAALVLSLGSAARADKVSDARDQFESAVKMRTMLEGYLEKDRSLDDYKQTIAAYYKVYLISPQAEEVTPSLVAEAELYQEMGRLYDPKYFQSAIGAYNFLLKQYPGSRYCSEAASGHRQDRATTI